MNLVDGKDGLFGITTLGARGRLNHLTSSVFIHLSPRLSCRAVETSKLFYLCTAPVLYSTTYGQLKPQSLMRAQ